MGSAFHQLCPRYSGTLTPTAPTAIKLWDTFTFLPFNLKISSSIIKGKAYKSIVRPKLATVTQYGALNVSTIPKKGAKQAKAGRSTRDGPEESGKMCNWKIPYLSCFLVWTDNPLNKDEGILDSPHPIPWNQISR